MRPSFFRWLISILALATTLAGAAHAQQSVPPPPPPPPPPAEQASPAPSVDKKEEAFARFKAGLEHFDRQEWSAALVEFLRSRELYPTRAATKNAAWCMRKEGRFDEALGLYEALLRETPDLSPQDKDFVDKEIQQLRNSIGTVDIQGAEPGATVVIDGRDRGTYPLQGPLRVSAGSHVIRVFKEGFLPFESRFDLAGKQALALAAHLGALVQSGRLRAAEQTGREVDVVVDGVVLGKAPWEGTLGIGDHTLVLRGEGNLGTQPAAATVKLNQLTSLTLIAEDLDGVARIEPTPATATVSVDGVVVGRGVWEGKLRVGGHVVEAAADGYLPFKREFSLGKGERTVVAAPLERDPNSAVWAKHEPGHFVLEADGALAVTPVFGGDVGSSCTGSCSSSLALGGGGVLHAAYQLPQGVGFGIDGGYLALSRSLTDRPATLDIVGGQLTNTGTVTDKISARGLILGLSAFYRLGDTWPVTLRFGLGAFIASVNDDRSGTLATASTTSGVPPGTPYSVSYGTKASASFLYAAPEIRFGRKLGAHLELNVGVAFRVMAGLSKANWEDNTSIAASPDPTTQAGDGLGTFGSQTMIGSFVIGVEPGLGLKYSF